MLSCPSFRFYFGIILPFYAGEGHWRLEYMPMCRVSERSPVLTLSVQQGAVTGEFETKLRDAAGARPAGRTKTHVGQQTLRGGLMTVANGNGAAAADAARVINRFAARPAEQTATTLDLIHGHD